MSTFTTRRLQARPVTADDLPVFERLWADERVARTLGGARDRAQVQEVLCKDGDHWCRWGFGRWLLQTGKGPVGTVKLARCEIAGLPEVELGYALFPEFWGLGYATEAAAGALDFGRDAAGLREVVAFALVSNAASLAVMRRLGFRHELDLELPAGPHELHRLALNSGSGLATTAPVNDPAAVQPSPDPLSSGRHRSCAQCPLSSRCDRRRLREANPCGPVGARTPR